MSEALKKLNQTTCEDSRSVISLPASESGHTHLERLDGQMILPCGPALAPVKVLVQAGNGEASQISVTYGLHGSGSLESAALSQSLANRLRAKTDLLGSTLFRLTWKQRVTPSGRRIYALRASARRTSDNGCTSLPTPCQQDGPKGGPSQGTDRLPGAVALATVNTPQHSDYHSGQAKRHLNRRESHHGRRNNDLAMLATVPTPMAGTPAQSGYNEAGSTDYARKIVNLATVATPRSTETGHSTGNPERALNHKSRLEDQVHLSTVSTPTAQDHSRGNKPAREWDTGVPLSQQAALSTVSTPSSRDWKGTPGMSESGVDPDGSIRSRLDQLPRQAQLAAIGETATGGTGETGSTGQLAPDYSRWLQGLPEEWASCADTATLSVHRKRKRS